MFAMMTLFYQYWYSVGILYTVNCRFADEMVLFFTQSWFFRDTIELFVTEIILVYNWFW